MKVSMIVLALALSVTACGQNDSSGEAAAVEDVVALNTRLEKLEAEKANSKTPAGPEAPAAKTEEAKKPELTQDEIWANEDKQMTSFGSVGSVSDCAGMSTQRTYRDEDGSAKREFITKIDCPSQPLSNSYFITVSQWSEKHSIWLRIRYNSDTMSFERAEAAYEAWKAKN
jgi:flagellum-specific peptidoglycan hydrolase FlgJ